MKMNSVVPTVLLFHQFFNFFYVITAISLNHHLKKLVSIVYFLLFLTFKRYVYRDNSCQMRNKKFLSSQRKLGLVTVPKLAYASALS